MNREKNLRCQLQHFMHLFVYRLKLWWKSAHTDGIKWSCGLQKASSLQPLHSGLQPMEYLLVMLTVGSVFGAQEGCQDAKPKRAFLGPRPRQHAGELTSSIA